MPSWIPTQPISYARSLREQWKSLYFTWRLTRFVSASFTRWLRRLPKASEERVAFVGRTTEQRRALVDRMIAMRDAGYSYLEIANTTGFSESSVRFLVKYGGRRKNTA